MSLSQLQVAIYARVSSEQQALTNTIEAPISRLATTGGSRWI